MDLFLVLYFCNLFSTFQTSSNYGEKLSSLAEGDIVGIMLTDSDGFKLIINGIEEEQLHWSYQNGQSVYAVFDLYGQCQQVKYNFIFIFY